MPSSYIARKARMAISPRLATRTLRSTGATPYRPRARRARRPRGPAAAGLAHARCRVAGHPRGYDKGGRMFKQVYDPVSNSLFLSSLFAVIPLLTLFVLLGGLKLKAHVAAL